METKPARYTSEFWIHNLILLANALNVLGAWNFSGNRASEITQAIVSGAYFAARGLAKQGVGYTPPPGKAP